MALETFKNFSQYIKKNRITVTILDVINPAHYVIKETPDLNASSEAKNFLEAEESMQKYYNSFDQDFFQLPLKDAIIVVLHEKKFYRAKVIKILNLSNGHLFKVYLVDYGVECSVTRDCIYKIENDFLSHPFQAVSMKLLGIEPISLVMNSADLTMSYGPVTYWDPSAEIYIHDMQKTMCNAYIEIKAVDEQCVYGSIFMCFDDNSVKCINDILIAQKFASFDENCWNKVYKIEDVLENKYAKTELKPEPKNSDPGSISDSSELENFGDFMNLRSSFISPSDGTILATSSLNAPEPSHNNPEDFVVKVQEKMEAVSSDVPVDKSTDHKVQEKCETVSSDVPVEKSPDPKAVTLSRFQKLQMLNKKRHSKCHVEETETKSNQSSYVSLDNTDSSVHLDAGEEIKPCVIGPPSVCTSNNLNDHSHQSDTEKSPSSHVYEKDTKEGNDALTRTPTSNKLKKLQELHRKRQNSPISNVHSAGSSDEQKLPSTGSSNKAENIFCDPNANAVENNDKVKDTSSVALTSPKQECVFEVETHVPNKLKKLQELHRKRLSNSALSTDSSKNSIESFNLCDTSSEKDNSKASDANKESLIELNNNKTNEHRKSSDSENLKSSPVQPSVFKDSSCSPESATISKLKKLQELHRKRRSNIVSSGDQLTNVGVSSDLENDFMSVPKDKKEDRSVSSNVIVSKDNFSISNTDNVSNVYNNSVSFKVSCDSSQVSKVMCDASSPSSLENSPRQDNKPQAQTYAAKRFQKLQELNRKRQSSAVQRNVHSFDGNGKLNLENATSATSEKISTISSDSSLNRNNECNDNINLPTVLSDNDIETCIQDSTGVSANSIFKGNDNTKDTVPSKVDDKADFNPATPSNSKDVYDAAASEDNSKQESISEARLAASRFQKLQLLRKRKSSSNSPNHCQGTDNVSTSSEKKENAAEFFSAVDSTPEELNTGESGEIKKASNIDGKSITMDDINSDYQVSDAEKTMPREMTNPTPEISLRPENKEMIISEKARTLQRLQQQVRKKNIKLQSNPTSETLLDSLNNNENYFQAKTPDVSQNQNSLSNVQNSEITLSTPSTLSQQSLNQEFSFLSEDGEIAYKRKESLDRNSPKISQTSNLILKSDHTTPGASTVSEAVSSNYSYASQKSPVSNACSSSYANQTKQALSSEKNTRARAQKSPSNDSRSNLDSEDSSPMQPKQSQILQEMLDLSDSDDILYSISNKKRESTCDNIDVVHQRKWVKHSHPFSDTKEGNYIELSTQLKHSDPKTLEFNELSLWQKQKVPALQIGIGLIKPILHVDEANFSKHIKQILKEIKFYGPSCIQSVIWPSIEKNRCMVAVAPPHSGKTVSYVLPLVSSFTEGKGPRSHNNGPSAIILCSSWLKAQAVYDLFYFFLGDKKMSIITLCTDGGHYRNKVISLINSCDVLIATPYCLLQYLKNDSIKFTQLDNLILDDSTALMNKHKLELKNILLNYMHAIKREGVASQLLLFAERWNKNFKLILDKMMSNPLILFTSFLESAVYAKISIVAHVCQSEEKKSTLIDVVAKEVGKVVICTTNISDAVDVHRFLSCEDVRSFLVNEELEHYIADEVIRDWKSIKCIANPHCLVITDQVLIKRLSISDADCLIHYDIPPESRLQFGNRFSCIAEHFQGTDHPHCVSHILVAESDYSYATQIMEIIENSGGKPSEALVELSLRQDQVEASSDLLCPYLKAFGFCKERLCKNRHTIDSEKDKPQIVPFEGDIQGFVTQIVDASHYYVRMLKYLDPVSNKTVSFVSAYAELGFLLRDFYCSAPDEMKVDLPVVGENYVLAEENNLFYRVKVLKEVNKDESTSWKFLFLDEGWIKKYEKPVLYKLTDQIGLPEPLAVEVYVCNIITPDSCFEWNPQTSQLVSDLIKGKEIHGRIALCLGRTLWLDPIALVLPLPNSNEFVNLFKLNQKLIDCGHARQNKNHLETLRKACTGKIPHPNVVKPRIKKEEKIPLPTPTISYAFLECNRYEDVYCSSVKSPHQFYVQRAKFVECLDNLLDKINDQIENRVLKKAFTLYKGMHCIAPFYEDDRYYRAVITDVFDSEVQLFYVDFGDNGKALKSNIYCIPAEFLLLPFQAIECELAGIAAAHGGWTDSSVDALVTLTRDESGDMKIVQLKAYTKTSCYDGGNHYVVDLWFNDKNLSEQLLQAGLGIPAEIPEITEHEPPVKVSQDSSPECSSDEEFDLNEKKLSSDEEDPEDKDTTALFYGYVAEMVMQATKLIPKPGVEITEVSSDEGKCVSNTNENDELKAQKAYKDLVKLLPNMNLGNRSGSLLEHCSSSLRPLITWWDTPEQLNILINLKDIKMYQLAVTDTGFNFNTIIAGIQYSADEKFYDEIDSSDARKYQTAQGINIIAKKLTPFKWPRFTKEKKKFLHIKYDLIHLDDSDEEQTSSTKKQNIRQEYMDEGSSSSTDEDEKYVEPWKDFAQQKNPFSVLE